jgi:hypothetical protein
LLASPHFAVRICLVLPHCSDCNMATRRILYLDHCPTIHVRNIPTHLTTVWFTKLKKNLRPSVTVSSLPNLPDIGEADPVMIDISYFATARILDKRSSPFGVEYRCELELPTELVKETPMGGVRVRSYENGLIRADRLGTLRDRKRKHSQM